MTPVLNRYDFLYLFDVTNGNPNGDPDAGNFPRLDSETGHGLVSDVSLKRRVRNYVDQTRAGEQGLHIYVQEGAVLNEQHRKAYRALRPHDDKVLKQARLNPNDEAEANGLRDFMCRNFFDIRTFGAVMATGINCGQVKGPVQMTFARSVEPIMPIDIVITRVASTNVADRKNTVAGKADGDRAENRTMGTKSIVPYGLYAGYGFISANIANHTGFSERDLELLFESLANMFELDRAASRGQMTARELVVFKHGSVFGNASAHRLFDRVSIRRKLNGQLCSLDDPQLRSSQPARKFSDYVVEVDGGGLSTMGIEVLRPQLL